MIRRLLAKAITSMLDTSEPPPVAAVPSTDDAEFEWEQEMQKLRDLLVRTERQRRELFDVILVMEAQRDEFKDMYYQQASEHQNGQMVLESALYVLRVKFNNLRNYLKDHDRVTIAEEKLLADPIGTSQKYREKMKKLADEPWPDPASPRTLLDGHAERARVAPDLVLKASEARVEALEKLVKALYAEQDMLREEARKAGLKIIVETPAAEPAQDPDPVILDAEPT